MENKAIKKSKMMSDTKFAYLISAPMILYLLLILFIPIIWGVSLSFTNKMIGGEAQFTGFDNYIKLLQDKEYLRSLLNTAVYTAFAIGGKIIFGTILALALNVEFKGRNICRAFLLIPWTLPNIVVVLNWKWIFSETGGVLNYILKSFHLINKDLVWFGSAGLAMAAVILVDIWRGTPFFGISILSKLQTIPADNYEAADIDGANTWQKFLYVTLPSIKDVIGLTALVSTIWTINQFESVWLLTGGGPNGGTELMNIYSYRTAMTSMQLGRGVAVSVLAMPILIILITLVTRKMLAEDN